MRPYTKIILFITNTCEEIVNFINLSQNLSRKKLFDTHLSYIIIPI